MAGTYVTDSGFAGQTFEENKAFWEAQFQSIFGNDIDLDPEGPIGQMVGIFALRDTNLWEAMAEIYTSRDADQATGVSLETLYAERGLIRISEGRTFVQDVLLFGSVGTTIPAASQARQSSGEFSSILYSLTGAVTILQSATRYVEITIGTPSGGEDFTVTLDGIPYTYTAGGGDDATDVGDELVTLVEAGSFTGSISNDAGTLTIEQISIDFSITFTVNITLDLIASAGSFQADTAGTFSCPANTLDTIVTPVAGWDSVNNPVAGDTGRERETDAEFRIRAAQTTNTGNATEQALINAVSNNVPGITQVSIQSNRTDVTDGEGLPPHSFELVVSGGLDQDIGNNIWETQAAGIASFGNTSVNVIDSEGVTQEVFFSRPTTVFIWLRVRRDFYDEESYPSDGDDQIKQAIVDWASINQTIGRDVIRQRLSTPIYSVPGVGDIEIALDYNASISHTPVYSEQNAPIAARETADFDISRIIVEAIP